MSLELRALIGKKKAIAALAAKLPGARVAELAEDLGLLPITLELESSFASQERTPAFAGMRLSARIEGLARAGSKEGAIVYAEADYSAGRDFQAAVVWDGGKLVGAPRVDRAAWDPREPAMTERPVNTALRALGVQCSGYGDEWDAVALARHPRTEDW